MVEVGSTVGNYRVVRKLGQGAMGAVYLAQHPTIGKRVALKVIRPELSNDKETLIRFFNEAKAVTQIGHANIVDIQDFGETTTGDHFIIMELLEGTGLGDLLRRERDLPIERIVHIAAQLTDGLAAAHARGIIHRDLKPDNVFLVPRGIDPDFVKILDFGLAKLTGPGAVSSNTKTGSVIGTPYYLAPEAAESSRNVDARADIYSLGCILFEMATGRVPFPGEGLGEILVRHLREVPPMPSRLRPDIPSWLEKIILHTLAKKPEFRFASMVALGKALRDPVGWERTWQDHQHDPSSQTQLFDPVSPPRPARVTPRPAVVDHAAPTVIGVERQGGPRSTGQQPVAGRRRATKQSGVGLALVAAAMILGVAGTLVYRLFTAQVTLQVGSTPSGAVVRVDGAMLGTTPATIALPRSRKNVIVTVDKDGYLQASHSVGLGRDAALELALAPVPAVVAAPVVAAPAPVMAAPRPAVDPPKKAVHAKKKDRQPIFEHEGSLLRPNF